jgi:hypothetical protein
LIVSWNTCAALTSFLIIKAARDEEPDFGEFVAHVLVEVDLDPAEDVGVRLKNLPSANVGVRNVA